MMLGFQGQFRNVLCEYIFFVIMKKFSSVPVPAVSITACIFSQQLSVLASQLILCDGWLGY